PQGLTNLTWAMSYGNAAPAFDLTSQFLAIEVRDPTTDAVTATLFTTDPAAPAPPPLMIPMTNFTASVAAYQGMTVRITVDLQVQQNCFFASFDGFALKP